MDHAENFLFAAHTVPGISNMLDGSIKLFNSLDGFGDMRDVAGMYPSVVTECLPLLTEMLVSRCSRWWKPGMAIEFHVHGEPLPAVLQLQLPPPGLLPTNLMPTTSSLPSQSSQPCVEAIASIKVGQT